MYRTQENFGRGNLVNCESPKFSLPIFTDKLKMYLAYALILAYLPNFFLPIAFTKSSFTLAFTCMVYQNFPMYVRCSTELWCIATQYILVEKAFFCFAQQIR